jgi:hypothetical protein
MTIQIATREVPSDRDCTVRFAAKPVTAHRTKIPIQRYRMNRRTASTGTGFCILTGSPTCVGLGDKEKIEMAGEVGV